MEQRVVQVGDVRLHVLVAGAGPAVVLLHGWPQTSYMWRRILPVLQQDFTVVAPDLRGYGLSDKPPGGYDMRTMARDIRELASALGFGRIAAVGHDRGARVVHRLALDHPDLVERAAFLDIVPTRELFRAGPAVARGYWHWLFHMQPDLPEQLVTPNLEAYLRFFFERWTVRRPEVEEAVPRYIEAFRRPGALRAGFDDYRATDEDLLADDEDFEAGRRLRVPVLALWGERGLSAALPVLDIWRRYADDVQGGVVPDCGHFLAEERPDLVARELQAFLHDAGSEHD